VHSFTTRGLFAAPQWVAMMLNANSFQVA
jgi:hypothetical protein